MRLYGDHEFRLLIPDGAGELTRSFELHNQHRRRILGIDRIASEMPKPLKLRRIACPFQVTSPARLE